MSCAWPPTASLTCSGPLAVLAPHPASNSANELSSKRRTQFLRKWDRTMFLAIDADHRNFSMRRGTALDGYIERQREGRATDAVDRHGNVHQVIIDQRAGVIAFHADPGKSGMPVLNNSVRDAQAAKEV